MKSKKQFQDSMAFVQSINQGALTGRTFGLKNGKETNTNGEYWLSFGKIINDKLIRNGSELGFVQYMSMCIDSFDEKVRKGSASNAEWDAMAQCQNRFIAGIVKVRDTLEPGDVVYKKVTNDLAYQIRRRDFEANKVDLEFLTENNDFCEGWS